MLDQSELDTYSYSSDDPATSFVYQIILNGSNDSFTGTVTGDSEILKQLSELTEIENQQLEEIQTAAELTQQNYTMLSYIFVLILSMWVFMIIRNVLNGIFGN